MRDSADVSRVRTIINNGGMEAIRGICGPRFKKRSEALKGLKKRAWMALPTEIGMGTIDTMVISHYADIMLTDNTGLKRIAFLVDRINVTPSMMLLSDNDFIVEMARLIEKSRDGFYMKVIKILNKPTAIPGYAGEHIFTDVVKYSRFRDSKDPELIRPCDTEEGGKEDGR